MRNLRNVQTQIVKNIKFHQETLFFERKALPLFLKVRKDTTFQIKIKAIIWKSSLELSSD